MINELDLASFPQFNELSEEIRKLILSYIADAPLEDKVPGPLGSVQDHHEEAIIIMGTVPVH